METWKPAAIVGEKTTEPSNTIPGDSLSVKEVLDRHQRGLPYRTSTPCYDFEVDEFDDNDGHVSADILDHNDVDPTDSPDFDMVDATQVLNELNDRVSRKRNRSSRQKSSAAPASEATQEQAEDLTT